MFKRNCYVLKSYDEDKIALATTIFVLRTMSKHLIYGTPWMQHRAMGVTHTYARDMDIIVNVDVTRYRGRYRFTLSRLLDYSSSLFMLDVSINPTAYLIYL